MVTLKYKKLLAFSLVELMISLITISCIAAAFTPVITKKLKKTDTALSIVTQITRDCTAKFTEKCSLCYKNISCVTCNRDCKENEYKNIETCLCEDCSTRDATGKCMACEKDKCTKCQAGYYLDNTGTCKICPKGSYCLEGSIAATPCPNGTYQDNAGQVSCKYCTAGTWSSSTGRTSNCTDPCTAQYYCINGAKTPCPDGTYSNAGASSCLQCSGKYENCTRCNKDNCNSCREGYSVKDGKCVFTCTGKYFLKIDSLCVTKYNFGDVEILSIPSMVYVIGSGGGYCDSTRYNCCWVGNTSTEGCDSDNGGYSGCNRMSCNWTAAKEICGSYKYGAKTWRLPVESEMANWAENTVNKGADGLQLCSYHKVEGVARCDYSTKCSGADQNICDTYAIHVDSQGHAYDYCNGWGLDNCRAVEAYKGASVRCVTNM